MKVPATRVLFCRSNSISPDPRVEKEASTLASAGYSVQVLGWDRTVSLPAEEQVGKISITRLPIRTGPAKGLNNLASLLRWQVGLLAWLVKHHAEYDIIHACDFDTILPALFCKLVWGKKVIYDIFDLYADMLRLTPKGMVNLIRWTELRALGLADAVILADQSRNEQIAGAHPRRVSYIYNSPDDVLGNLPSTIPHTNLRIAYIGNLQIQRGLLVIIQVLRKYPEWTLDLAGFGADQEVILSAAKGLPNVTWHGLVSYERALQLNAAADVLVATYDPSIPNHRYSSPNKVFEAMLLAKPVIVSRGTNIDRVIADAGCGMVVPYGDPDSIESVLLRLQSEPDLRQRLGENGRKTYENQYAWTIMQKRLLDLYRDIGVCASV